VRRNKNVLKRERHGDDNIFTGSSAFLHFEGLFVFPCEAFFSSAEVTVLGGLGELWLTEVEVTDNLARTEVKVLVDNGEDFLVGLFAGAVSVDGERQWLGDADGVRDLDEDTSAEACLDEGLGHPSGGVGARPVDLGVVLTGEGTTAVGTPAAVGVDNDLTAGEAGVTLWSTDDESAGWVDVVDGFVGEVFGWDDNLDDLLHEGGVHVLVGDVWGVLGRDDDGVDVDRNDGATVLSVQAGDLGLGVRTQPSEGAVLTETGHLNVEAVREGGGERHAFLSLVGGVAKHEALVTGTFVSFGDLGGGVVGVDALGNVHGLLLDGNEDVAGLVVEALGRVVVSNFLDGTTNNLLVVEDSLGGDFTEDHDHAGLGCGFASNTGGRVLLEASIDDGIGNLVTDFVCKIQSTGEERRGGSVEFCSCGVWCGVV